MGVRLLEGGVALGFGAGEALVASKMAGAAPGGIPWAVVYEAAGVGIGFFGGKVGVPAEVRDSVLLSALGLAGARVTRAALAGRLLAGPKAWGGDHGGEFLGDAGAGGGNVAAFPANRGLRQLQSARGGGWSVSGGFVPVAEAPGVAG